LGTARQVTGSRWPWRAPVNPFSSWPPTADHTDTSPLCPRAPLGQNAIHAGLI